MIAKPTTEQILNDCSRELMEVVLPAVTDETVQVTIYMMDLVLRNAAVRAAHEIAWMTEETAELEAFADSGAPRRPPVPACTSTTSSSATAPPARRSPRRWSEAVAAGDGERTRQGTSLLARRVGKEQEIMCGWSPVGR